MKIQLTDTFISDMAEKYYEMEVKDQPSNGTTHQFVLWLGNTIGAKVEFTRSFSFLAYFDSDSAGIEFKLANL